MNVRGITVCVNYDDLLNITLVRNMRHLAECWVVTHPDDSKTIELCHAIPNVHVYTTDAFYRYGAKFNKGLAIEEGFERMGRTGWILIWDADTLFPDAMPLDTIKTGNLYTPPRLICRDPRDWKPEYNWKSASPSNDRSWAGYYQLFHASDPMVQDLPWYDVTFTHAGGGDGYFQSRWPTERKLRLPFQVLHLGPRDCNWFGRASVRADSAPLPDWKLRSADMETFLAFKGWARNRTVTEFQEHVEVPGYQPSGYIHRGNPNRPQP